MSGPTPAVRPRPMGGFSQGMGAFGEHLDESAMQSAMQQKSLQQQQAGTPTKPGQPVPGQTAPHQAAAAPPREVGTIKEELVDRPSKDVVRGLLSLFDINSMLGIKSVDTPEQQAKKTKVHQKYQKLSQDEQQEAQKRYRFEMERKKHQQEEADMKRQQAAQKADQDIAVPTSVKRGPIGPGTGKSKKQDAVAQLSQQRKTLGNAGQKF